MSPLSRRQMINRLGGGLGAVALAGTVRGSEPPHFGHVPAA